MKVQKVISTLLFSISIFLMAGCVKNPHESITGRWQVPSGNGSYIEIMKGGALISHIVMDQSIEKIYKTSILQSSTNLYFEANGHWEIIDNSQLVFTLEFDDIISDTNSIIRISKDMMVLDINGKNTTYIRAQ